MVTDLGFAKRARTFAELVGAPLAIIEKRREGNDDRAEVMNVIGEVRGKRAIIVDDEIDTGGTLVETTKALEREGALEIYGCATHGVLSDPAIDRIRESALREVVITDTIPLPASHRLDKIKVLSVAPLIGEAITRIHQGESVGALFSSEMQRTQAMLLWGEDDEEPRMTDGVGPAASRGRAGKTTMYRPAAEGGLEARPGTSGDYRDELRSRRWNAAPLENPEVEKTDPRIAVAAHRGCSASSPSSSSWSATARPLEPAGLGASRRSTHPAPRRLGLERHAPRRLPADRPGRRTHAR